jgi:hypothetical protein
VHTIERRRIRSNWIDPDRGPDFSQVIMHRILRTALIAVAGSFALTACVSRVEAPRPMPAQPPQAAGASGATGAPSVATTLVLEQFLRAANTKDLDTMARLFGTVDGPITVRDPADNVDIQMDLLATILRHQDYAIEGKRIVPGRRDEATLVNVRMTVDDRIATVPFTLVWSRNGSWLIEQIGIESLTKGR